VAKLFERHRARDESKSRSKVISRITPICAGMEIVAIRPSWLRRVPSWAGGGLAPLFAQDIDSFFNEFCCRQNQPIGAPALEKRGAGNH